MTISPPEQTYHSILWRDYSLKTIVKRSRHQTDPRALIRWQNEVRALGRVGYHVGGYFNFVLR